MSEQLITAPPTPSKSDSAASSMRMGGDGLLGQILRQRGFISCLTLLIVLAAGFKAWSVHAEIQWVRLPLPPRKPLDRLDATKLFPPYRLKFATTIKDEVLETLGTDQYISWTLEDTSASGPERVASLFVTYYTGKPDQVPHVPDVCYQASGYQPVDAFFREIAVPALGAGVTVPVKVLIIKGSTLLGRSERVVMYTFHANGRFAPDRRDVQSVLSDPRDRYAYFSKLEVTFGTPDQLPSKEEAIAAGERLLQAVLPVLLSDHWPDWAEATRVKPQ